MAIFIREVYTKNVQLYFFLLQFLVIESLDRNSYSFEMRDPDPYPVPDSINPDPQHCQEPYTCNCSSWLGFRFASG
jgi:hypothetical protein